MKFRTDFVTNSSSSGFVAVYAVSKTGQAVQLCMAEEDVKVDEEMLARVLALESMEDWYQWLHDLEEANDCEIGYLPEEEWDEDADPEMLAKKAYQCLLQGVIETIDDLAGVKVEMGEDEGGEFVDPEEAAEAVGLDLDELESAGLDEEEALIVGYRKVYYSEMADRTEGDIWEEKSIRFINVDLQWTGIELSETSQEGQIAVSYQGKCRVLPRSQVQNYVNELLQQKKQEDQDKNYVNVTPASSSGFVVVYAMSKTGQTVELLVSDEYVKVDEEMLTRVLTLESMKDWYQWLHDLEEANDCKIGYLPEEEWDEDLDPEMLAKKAYQSLLQGVIETIDDLAGVKVDQLEDESSEFVDQDEVAKAVGLDLDELELDGLDEEKALIVGYRKVYFSEIADRTEGDIWEDDTIYFTNVDLQGTGIELSETSQEGQIAVSYQGKCRVLPRSQVQNHVNELLQQKK